MPYGKPLVGLRSKVDRRAFLLLRWYVIGALVYLTLYAIALPFGASHRWLGGVAYQLPPLVAIACTVGAIFRSQGRTRWAWGFLLLMLLSWETAESWYSYYSLVLVEEAPFPSVADAFYYAGYGSFAIGMILLARSGRVLRDARGFADSLTVMLVAGLLTWHFLAGPAAESTADGQFGGLVALGYPLLDLCLFSIVVFTYYGSARDLQPSMSFLVLAAAVLIVTDSAYGLVMQDTVDSASVLDLGWQLSYVLIGAAAICAGREKINEASAHRHTAVGLILPYATVLPLAAASAVLVLLGRGRIDLTVGSMLAMGLLLARQWTTLVENLRLFQASVEREAELKRSTLALESARREAVYLAEHDVLTGAKNRRAWFADGVRIRPTAVAVLDIDRFKLINDAHGHPAGDQVLINVTHAIQQALPRVASFGRLGGEEFGLIWETPVEDAMRDIALAIRVVEGLSTQLPRGEKLVVTVSAGLAAWPGEGASREEALATAYERADRALYEAKASGRNRLVVWERAKAA